MFGNLAPTDIINIVNAVLYVLVFISFFFLPRLLTWQIVSSLEFKVKTYNDMVIKSQRLILKKIGTKTKLTKKELDDSVKGMMDYFVIEPDAVEPSGLANKIRQLTQRHDKKLDMFIDDITSGMTPEEKKNLAAGMMHTIGIYQISKIIRHWLTEK